MEERKPEFDTVMKQVASRREATDHPDDEILLDYFTGSLVDAEADTLRDHLAECSRCTRIVLALGTVPEMVPPEEEVSPEVLARGRREFADRIARDSAAVRVPERKAPMAWYRFLQVAASLLLVTSIGLAQLAFQRERQVDPSQPVANIAIEDRRPETERTRGTDLGNPKLSWPTDRDMILLLNPPKHEVFTQYRIAIYREDGSHVWQDDGFQATKFGNLP